MFKSLNRPKTSPQSSETSASPGSTGVYKFSLPAELVFIVQIFLLWMMLFTAFRAGLLIRNALLFTSTPVQTLFGSFLVGARFDCLVTCQLLLPLLAWLLIPLLGWQYRARLIQLLPLVLALLWSPLIFLSMAEWEFYREFHDRFNNLAIQYITDDPSTVLSMIWHGYPVLWYFVSGASITALIYYGQNRLLKRNLFPVTFTWKRHLRHVLPIGVLMAILLIIGARGTLTAGPASALGRCVFQRFICCQSACFKWHLLPHQGCN